MSLEVYDADGNQVEGVLSPEEATALQSQIEETKEKLTKLENKDFNFRRLEQMTEEEKDKLSAAELSLKQQQEALEAEQKSFKESFVGDIKKDTLEKFVGEDEELLKKVEFHMARFPESKTAQSRSEIEGLVKDAMLLATGGRSSNPLNAAMNASGSAPARVQKEKLSDEAMNMASKFGLTAEDIEKYS